MLLQTELPLSDVIRLFQTALGSTESEARHAAEIFVEKYGLSGTECGKAVEIFVALANRQMGRAGSSLRRQADAVQAAYKYAESCQAIVCPKNRDGTRRAHGCSDADALARPEWLIAYFASTKGQTWAQDNIRPHFNYVSLS